MVVNLGIAYLSIVILFINQSLLGDYIVAKLSKLAKVNDNFIINRYDNGWMVEVSGRREDDDWVTTKVLCMSEEEVFNLIREYNAIEIAN